MSETTTPINGTQAAPEAAAPAEPTRFSVEQATEILLRQRSETASAGAAAKKPEDEDQPLSADTSEDTGQEAPDQPAEEQPPETEQEPPAEGTTDEDPEFDVQVGDKPERVRLSELAKGYLRQADYSRKTAELAEARRAFSEHDQAVRKERADYGVLLKALKTQIETAGNTGIDMEALRRSDPVAWVEQREIQREQSEKLAAIQSEESRLAAEARKDHEQATASMREQATKFLLDAIPEWQKPDVRTREVTDLMQMAKEVYGYTQAEIDMIIDPRYIMLARDAMLGRRARGQGLAAKRQQPAPARPIIRARSTPASDPNATRRQAAQAQFSKRPTLQNAVDALLAERGEQ